MVTTFISYSHDIEYYKKKVIALHRALRRDGINSIVDIFENPEEGWPNWMLKQIRNSDFVLIAFNESYSTKFLNLKEDTNGKGVKFESHLILNLLYQHNMYNNKILPVVFNSNDSKYIPSPFNTYTFYLLDSQENYKRLYSKLTNQKFSEQIPVGEVKSVEISEDIDDPLFSLRSDATIRKTEAEIEIENTEIEIRLDRDFSSFDLREQEKFLRAVKELLEIRNGNIRIVKIKKGSVKITLSMPVDQAEKLKLLVASGDLDGWNAIHAVVKDPTEVAKTETNEIIDRGKNERYSKAVKAGKRTYFFEVKPMRSNEYYLTITESKRKIKDDKFYYEKHKIFLYKEDFQKFLKALQGTIDHVKDKLMPEFDSDQPKKSEYFQVWKKEEKPNSPHKKDDEEMDLEW